jgi:copper(I)-binding protein
MRALLSALLIGLAALAGPAAHADESGIHIVDVHARATPPGITTGMVYLVMMNHGAADDSLTGVSSPVAASAGLYRSSPESGVSAGPPVTDFKIKANEGVTFKPDGLHIMLMGLKQPLRIGDSFPVTLSFAKAGPVDITVTVQALSPSKAGKPGMKM